MRIRSAFLLLLLAVTVTGGCGGGEKEQRPPPPPPKQLPQPRVTLLAPTAVSAGDTVTVFGLGFATADIGVTRLRLAGVFQTTGGQLEQVDIQVEPAHVNDRELAWAFGPNIPLSKSDSTGSFRGTVVVTNVGKDGKTKSALPLNVQLTVRPSILIKQLRPLSAGCPVGITDTVEDAEFLLELDVVGLKRGSAAAPLRYVYTFMREHFRFEGYVGGTLGWDPEALFPQSGPISVVDDVKDGSVSRLGSGVPSDTYVQAGAVADGGVSSIVTGTDNLFKLSKLKTAAMPNVSADSFPASIVVRAVDSTGAIAKRTLSLRVWAAVEVDYQGGHEVVRSYDPVPVSGCIDGGAIGRDVTYSESSAETRTRAFKLINKVGGAINIVVARLSAEFGIEVTSEVSSEQSKDLRISAKILPNEYGVFYRQTLQLERKATLRGHGPCGNAQSLGDVVVTDWIWSPDLAKGKVCPPLPPSNLPPGKIFEKQ